MTNIKLTKAAGQEQDEQVAFEAWWATSGMAKFKDTAEAAWQARAALAPVEAELRAMCFNFDGMREDRNAWKQRALAQHQPLIEWQPIDTAPTGRTLLLYFPAGSGRSMLNEMVRVDIYPVSYPRKPSHWMPLPPYPKATS